MEALSGHFRNAGHLPATELSWVSDVACDEDGDRKKFKVVDSALDGKMILTPGACMRRATARILSTEFRLFGGAKERYCYVWGRVRYRDGFGALQMTDFCHRYNCEALRENGTIPEKHARVS